MIPLVKPTFPSWKEIEPYFTHTKDTGKFSNFGPCFDLAVERLGKRLQRYVLPVQTGTAAIQIALQAKLKPWTKVALPDFTHVGTLTAIVAAGMQPVLFPVSRKEWTLDRDVLKEHWSELGAIVVVSPFGYKVNFKAYDDLAQELGIPLFYDLAGAWGMDVTTKNTHTYSLHATKNFSCGEGGLICFSSQEDWDRAKRLSNFDTLPDRTVASINGNNLKCDDLKCAIILAHLDSEVRILRKAERKRKLISYYQDNLKSEVVTHDLHLKGAAPSLCVVGGLQAEKLEEQGRREGVEFKRYYVLLSEMPALSKVQIIKPSGPFFRTTCAFPSDVSEAEAKKVVQTAMRILA